LPRSGKVVKREISLDNKYNSVLAARFIHNLMRWGKRSLAERIFYEAMDIIAKKTGKDPLEVFQSALNNARPILEVKSRRVGGATYQVPIEVRKDRQSALAIRWMINFARLRGENTMQEKLAGELLDASNNIGATIKKKEDTRRMAEANKAFAHYGW